MTRLLLVLFAVWFLAGLVTGLVVGRMADRRDRLQAPRVRIEGRR